MSAESDRVVRVRDGRVLYDDAADHAALCARLLELSDEEWLGVIDEYVARCGPERDGAGGRIRALAEAFAPRSPHSAPLSSNVPVSACPICGDAMRPAVARRARDGSRVSVFARCGQCRHGALASDAAPASIYNQAAYYRQRDEGGAGYASYLHERAYREDKGRRLLDRIAALAGRPLSSLVEVGSGFGFTRRAAAERGMTHAGVDVNPHAAEVARSIHGFETMTGTLDEALASGAIARGATDLVLFQFVLEHLPDPIAALVGAARALAPGGVAAVLVPNMDAAELDAFQGSYRSLRHDHLHLFSPASLARAMERAGMRPHAIVVHSSVRLLRGFIGDEAIDALDAAGRGPDLLGIATLENG